MTDETNAAEQSAGEDTAAVLAMAESGEKTYLEPKAEPEAKETTSEDPGDDADAAKPDTEAEADAPKPKKTAKDRIDELTWRLREAERREATLLDRIGGKQAPAQEAHTETQGDGRPDPEAYEGGAYDPLFIEHLTDWKAEQAVNRRMSEREERQTVETQFQAFKAKTDELFPEGESEGFVAFRQYPKVTPTMTEVILSSDIGPKLAEHLGDNPREFQRLSGLSPALQARELTLLETRLAPPKADAKPTPKTTTNAPEPAPQARGSGGQFKVSGDTSDFAAFEKQYRIGG